jgi:hypothetical protein
VPDNRCSPRQVPPPEKRLVGMTPLSDLKPGAVVTSLDKNNVQA